MCLGIPARVTDPLDSEPDFVTAEVAGAARRINTGLLDGPLEAGDWVMVHTGFALMRMTDDEAHEAMALLERLSAAHLEHATADPPVPEAVAGWLADDATTGGGP
jgi:hydrogenase expression/formation protein HypC